MGFKCGIVGLPNVGKSTLFNALTEAGIEAANYPFCTIEPNVGVVAVPDPRLDKLADIVKPQKVVPTAMEFVDIAGLVAGASKGEGLGNQFLSNIRETDAIAHVVRCFIDENVTHVSTTVDPIRDIEIIDTELQLADLDMVEKRIQRLEKQAKSGDKESKAELAVLIPAQKHLADGHSLRTADFCNELRTFPFGRQLITSKPVMYIANVAEDHAASEALLNVVKQYSVKENAVVVDICAHIESEIATLNGEEKLEFLQEMGLEEPGLNRVIRAGYDLLGLKTYFTAGVKEVRAWTFKEGSTAPQAAAVIHTDFEKGFIRAEVISYDDFVTFNGEQGAKEAGKWRLEGKDYLPKDGDVMHFRFNV